MSCTTIRNFALFVHVSVELAWLKEEGIVWLWKFLQQKLVVDGGRGGGASRLGALGMEEFSAEWMKLTAGDSAKVWSRLPSIFSRGFPFLIFNLHACNFKGVLVIPEVKTGESWEQGCQFSMQRVHWHETWCAWCTPSSVISVMWLCIIWFTDASMQMWSIKHFTSILRKKEMTSSLNYNVTSHGYHVISVQLMRPGILSEMCPMQWVTLHNI